MSAARAAQPRPPRMPQDGPDAGVGHLCPSASVAAARVPRAGERPSRRKHRHQVEVPAPSLPAGLRAEADALIGIADLLLTEAVAGRRRGLALHTADLVRGKTLKRQCEALCGDPDLGIRTLGLRLLGRRLDAIGGHDLIEFAIAKLAREGAQHADLRHQLVRAAFDHIGEHLG